ncbi:uncharacterized protein LOC117342781 [Pecten maximus]|uniref:uncharacterized protein LOC117342781 n=1 Tax=Pecten maximus TaxID=6579 RepID=UPI001458F575|nr:uncharacterized protein LOC117342781 [Pecten maximus]
MNKMMSAIRSLFILFMVQCIYAAVLQDGVSPRKQRRLLKKAMRQIARDPLLSPGLPVSEFAPIPGQLMNPGIVDPLLMQSPLDSLLTEHQGLLSMGIGPQRPRMDTMTRDLINHNKAIGTRESLRQNRQIKKGLRKARKQFRQEKRARKQIRKQQRLMRKAAKQVNIIGGPHDVMGGTHDVMGGLHGVMGGTHGVMGGLHDVMGGSHGVMGGRHDVMGGLHDVMGGTHGVMGGLHDVMGGTHDVMGLPHGINGLSAPISPLHPDHHVAEDLLLNGGLNINKKIAKQDRKAIKQIKRQQKIIKKIAKQAKLVDRAMDLIPVPEPVGPLTDSILISDALNINNKIAKKEKKRIRQIKKQQKIMKKVVNQAGLINQALDTIPLPEPHVPLQPDHHLTDKILINDALNNNKHLAQNILINDAINRNQHIAEKILVNDALNKGSLLGVGGIHDHHLHGGDAIVTLIDADHPPPHHPHHQPHHPPPAPPKQNPIKSLVKGVILGGLGAMLLGK